MSIEHTFRTGRPCGEIETKALTPITAIRAHCVECMGGSVMEPKNCAAILCALHPFREGDAQQGRRPLSDEQREILRERLSKSRGEA